MKPTTKLLVPFVAVVGVLSLATAGWAYWTTSGTGNGSASVATLAPPTAVTVPSTSTGTVAISWTASSTAPPNATPAGYYVQRYAATTPSDACGTSMSPTPVLVSATSCNDSAPSGTYTYKVTAVFQSWTASATGPGSVTVSTDTTAPTLVAGSLQMFDTNFNGKVDQVKATFSETLASYTAGTTPWTLTNVPSGGTLSSVSVTGAIATLTLNEVAGAADTAVGTFTVALATNANGIRDAAGNQSSFAATAPTDKAGPVVATVEMLDQTANGKVDRLRVTYSETVIPVTPATTSNWTLANVPSAGSLNTSTAVTGSGTSQIIVPITEGAAAANTAVGSFTVASAAGAVSDAVSNPSIAYAATAPVDKAGPVVATVEMLDQTANGKVDRLRVTYSETVIPVTPATTSNWTLANVPSAGSLNTSTAVTGSGTSQIIVPITEGAAAANTAVGSFTVASAAGAVSDAVSNPSIAYAATAPVDKAAPVITITEANGTGNKEIFNGTTTETIGTLTINVYAGSTATGPIVKTYTITNPALIWSTPPNANGDLTTGTTYTAQATHVDGATNTSNQSTTAPFLGN